MSDDAKPLNDQSATAASTSTLTAIVDPGAVGDPDLGYEAADPSLHAPFWCEAMQSGTTRSLR